MTDVKDTDWAYAAGFVDGEGCIAITRSFNSTRARFYYGVCVVVVNHRGSETYVAKPMHSPRKVHHSRQAPPT